MKACDFCRGEAIVAYRYPDRTLWWFGCADHVDAAHRASANISSVAPGARTVPGNVVVDPDTLGLLGDWTPWPHDVFDVPLIQENAVFSPDEVTE